MIFMSPISGIAQDKPDRPDIEILDDEEWRSARLRNWVESGGEQWAYVGELPGA